MLPGFIGRTSLLVFTVIISTLHEASFKLSENNRSCQTEGAMEYSSDSAAIVSDRAGNGGQGEEKWGIFVFKG